MNTYEIEPIGNIIIIKNIIFENNITNKKETDHAWKNGRPCIIIYSDDEYDYILPLTSNYNEQKYPGQHVELTIEHLIFTRFFNHDKYKLKRRIKGGVNLQTIYKIPISGHNQINKVTFEKYKEIIRKLKLYHKQENILEIIERAQIMRGR